MLKRRKNVTSVLDGGIHGMNVAAVLRCDISGMNIMSAREAVLVETTLW